MSRRSTSRWMPAALMKYGLNSGLFDRALVVVDEIFFCIGGASQGRLWSASRTASRLSQIIAASRSSGQYLLKYEVLVNNACSSKHRGFLPPWSILPMERISVSHEIPLRGNIRRMGLVVRTSLHDLLPPRLQHTYIENHQPLSQPATVFAYSLLKHHNLNPVSLDHPWNQC